MCGHRAGGHAQFLEPGAMAPENGYYGRRDHEDAARVMARYACGIGLRILEDKVPYYGAGNELLREYAHWANVPILNMADDKFHPCQAWPMSWAGPSGTARDPAGPTMRT